MKGKEHLEKAEWLLGFDFDGTLADVENDYSVHPLFFEALRKHKKNIPLAWGICTGRSLEFTLEGIENAQFPIMPDYIVAQERDVFYHVEGQTYTPDVERNDKAKSDLQETLLENESTLKKVEKYITGESQGQWINIPEDPSGIIASHENEIQKAVDIFNACGEKCSQLDYQRNTIYLRFTHKGYCKGTAIQHLQETFDISKNKTLVVGDNYNDLTMLNKGVAKYYSAPSNAIPELKEKLKETGGILTKSPHVLGVTEAIELVLSTS